MKSKHSLKPKDGSPGLNLNLSDLRLLPKILEKYINIGCGDLKQLSISNVTNETTTTLTDIDDELQHEIMRDL